MPNGPDDRIAREECKELIQSVNSLLLLFYDKITGFWKQLFFGCTGFVALVVPVAINAEISSDGKMLLLCSIIMAILAALCLIYPLVKGAINIKKIHEAGRHVLIDRYQMKDYARPYCTKPIILSVISFGIMFFGALTLLGVALYTTISWN